MSCHVQKANSYVDFYLFIFFYCCKQNVTEEVIFTEVIEIKKWPQGIEIMEL